MTHSYVLCLCVTPETWICIISHWRDYSLYVIKMLVKRDIQNEH